MKCRYCNEEGHKIQDCNKGLHLNKILDNQTKPNLLTMSGKDLQRIASLNNIKYYLSKKELIIEITNVWIEKDKKRNTVYDNNECVICYENIFQNNNVVLSCGHKYHFECILLALQKKILCPICRIEIIFKRFKFNNEINNEINNTTEITDDIANIISNMAINNNDNDILNFDDDDDSPYNNSIRIYDRLGNSLFICNKIYKIYIFLKKHNNFIFSLFGLIFIYMFFKFIKLDEVSMNYQYTLEELEI